MPTLEQSMQPVKDQHVEVIQPPAPGAFGPSIAPQNPSYPRFQVTSLPLSVVYQPDALRQFYRGGVPQQRIIPNQR